MAVEFVDGEQEVVVSLAASLETPNEPEVETVVEGDAGVVADAEAVVETKIEEAVVSGATKEEISELRGLLRELRNDNISLKTRLEAAERVQNGEFGTDGASVEKTELSKYNEQLQEAGQRDFSNLLAVMEVNPKYEDVHTVCTNSNFDDMFEKVAAYRSNENGSDMSTELVKVKAEIWSMANPYKYMYEIIKEYHPKYAVKETVKETAVTPKTAAEVLATTKKVVTAPGSVADLGGGDETKGGWTAEKIDNMPESKLHEVPKDIYKKWLSGELN